MFTRHVSAQLAQYADGQLPRAAAGRVDAHLAGCVRCRAELEDIRFAASLLRQVDPVSPPASVWNGIAANLDARPRAAAPLFVRGPLALTAALLLLAAGGAYWSISPRQAVWPVARLGVASPREALAPGEWLETGDGRARITVGTIGFVDVEPLTRVRLGSIAGEEHRIELARGTISARISAPPRLFFVETPASTVVDLGCAYTITVDEDGAGELHMTEGWSALEWNGRESLVPAGAMCRTRPRAGPGTPYFEDATPAFKAAVDDFDVTGGAGVALDTILREARVRDTLTLWHLLSRVDEPLRSGVFDRMVALTPLPDGIAREAALRLDPETLERWRDELAWTW